MAEKKNHISFSKDGDGWRVHASYEGDQPSVGAEPRSQAEPLDEFGHITSTGDLDLTRYQRQHADDQTS